VSSGSRKSSDPLVLSYSWSELRCRRRVRTRPTARVRRRAGTRTGHPSAASRPGRSAYPTRPRAAAQPERRVFRPSCGGSTPQSSSADRTGRGPDHGQDLQVAGKPAATDVQGRPPPAGFAAAGPPPIRPGPVLAKQPHLPTSPTWQRHRELTPAHLRCLCCRGPNARGLAIELLPYLPLHPPCTAATLSTHRPSDAIPLGELELTKPDTRSLEPGVRLVTTLVSPTMIRPDQPSDSRLNQPQQPFIERTSAAELAGGSSTAGSRAGLGRR